MNRIRLWRCPVVGCRRRRRFGLRGSCVICTGCAWALNREIHRNTGTQEKRND